MHPRPQKRTRRWNKIGALALVFALMGCAAPPPTGSVAIRGLAPGLARVWFYRIDLPYVALERPYVRMNGAIVGISEPGGAFYRDVAPGTYYVTVDSYGRDVNQFPEIAVVAGRTVYLQVIGSRYWASGGASANYLRPTFYVWLMPPEVAAPQVAQSPFYPAAN
jgi:hypothetical protein